MSEATGGRVNYYLASVAYPQREEQPPYQAECEDIIEALGMTFDEGCMFKAIWRSAASRQGNSKPGHSPIYDGEKIVHYAGRNLRRLKRGEKARTDFPKSFYAKPVPKEEDWVPWEGGACPVPPGATIYIQLRDNSEERITNPDGLRWRHKQDDGDIIAYRFE